MFLYIAVFFITITNGFSSDDSTFGRYNGSTPPLNGMPVASEYFPGSKIVQFSGTDCLLLQDIDIIGFRSVTYDIQNGELVKNDPLRTEHFTPLITFLDFETHEQYRQHMGLLPIMGPYNVGQLVKLKKGSCISKVYHQQNNPFELTLPCETPQLAIHEAPGSESYDLGNILPDVKFLDLHGKFVRNHTAKDIKDVLRKHKLHVHFQYPGWRSANLQTFIRQTLRFPPKRF